MKFSRIILQPAYRPALCQQYAQSSKNEKIKKGSVFILIIDKEIISRTLTKFTTDTVYLIFRNQVYFEDENKFLKIWILHIVYMHYELGLRTGEETRHI